MTKEIIIHLLVDSNGSPISFEVTPVSEGERQQVEKLLSAIEDVIYQSPKAVD